MDVDECLNNRLNVSIDYYHHKHAFVNEFLFGCFRLIYRAFCIVEKSMLLVILYTGFLLPGKLRISIANHIILRSIIQYRNDCNIRDPKRFQSIF